MRFSGKIAVFAAAALLTANGARAAEETVYTPTSSWLVGPVSVASPDDIKGHAMPCVMMNQYDNGYTFRVSAGGERVLAMAVDFHQPAFEPGKSYRVDLSIPPYVDVVIPADAYNQSILTMNTQKIAGLYKNLSAGKTMKIGIGGKTMEFALLGVHDGLQRVENCVNGGKEEEAPAPAETAVPSTNPAIMPPPPPLGMQTDAAADAAPPMMPQDAIPQVPAEAPPAETAAQAPDPGAASMVDDMLRNAAEKSGQVKEAAPAQKPAEAKPAPTAQQQGQALAQAWTSGTASGAQREIMVPRADSRLNALAGQQGQQAEASTWRAMHGAGLQEVLDVWTSQAHVNLLWMAGRDFPVMKSVSLQGTFESAVQGLLEQYQGGGDRPVGKIYNDPATGKRVLLVETSKN